MPTYVNLNEAIQAMNEPESLGGGPKNVRFTAEQKKEIRKNPDLLKSITAPAIRQQVAQKVAPGFWEKLGKESKEAFLGKEAATEQVATVTPEQREYMNWALSQARPAYEQLMQETFMPQMRPEQEALMSGLGRLTQPMLQNLMLQGPAGGQTLQDIGLMGPQPSAMEQMANMLQQPGAGGGVQPGFLSTIAGSLSRGLAGSDLTGQQAWQDIQPLLQAGGQDISGLASLLGRGLGHVGRGIGVVGRGVGQALGALNPVSQRNLQNIMSGIQ